MKQKIITSNFYSIREPIEVSFEASKEKLYGDDWIVQIGNFRLLKVLLLYGSNGSGKTNILLALDFLQEVIINIPQNVGDKFDYMPFAFDTMEKEKPTVFFMAIKNNWLVILDEFGAGMQARTQHLLLDFFLKMSRRSQLIFATQSLGFLDFPKMRRDSLLIISKDKIGQSKVDAHTIRNIHKKYQIKKGLHRWAFYIN